MADEDYLLALVPISDGPINKREARKRHASPFINAGLMRYGGNRISLRVAGIVFAAAFLIHLAGSPSGSTNRADSANGANSVDGNTVLPRLLLSHSQVTLCPC